MNLKLKLKNNAGTKVLHLTRGKTLQSRNLKSRKIIYIICSISVH